MPFYPSLGDRLRKLASNYGFRVWFTYPGNVSDMFTCHRGRSHKSKSRNSVYCAYCTCGTQYIGESKRNLKIRLNEHTHISSNSAFSQHLQCEQHRPVLKDTVILATEPNTLKRKLIESLCISNKKVKTCNTGVSFEFAPIWNALMEPLQKQVSHSD